MLRIIKFFLCNLQCNGFGQDDPTNPESYILPYKDFDLIDVKNVEDLPVWKYGCDSSYSWSKKFSKIQKRGNPDEVAKKLYDLMNDHRTHIAFTGGEPMMKAAQKNIVKIFHEMKKLFEAENEWGYYGKKYNNHITNVTFETNGTRPIEPVMNELIRKIPNNLLWSVLWIKHCKTPSYHKFAKEITIETMNRGYNVSARVHCYIFGNQIGT